MREINWNEAPEWADRAGYTESNDLLVWLNQKQYTYADGSQNGRIFKFSSEGVFPLEDFHNIQYRPPQWRGMQDGLPPIGEECDTDTRYGWLPGKIVSHGEDYAVSHLHDNPHGLIVDWSRTGFRPIESERDKGIDEAMSHIRQDWYAEPSVSISEFVTNAVAQLYDAGYRKPMSREAAHEKLTLMMMNCDNGEDIRGLILDALGYKE